MTSNAVFDEYGFYYDLLYRDKDYIAEVDYIDSLLARFGVAGCDVLEFGSGTGKHGKLLAKCGYTVTGIERSKKMVAQAVSAEGFSCQQGDICSVQLKRTFGVVLSLFHVISYQVRNEDLKAVFSRAAEHLEQGGLFVFDVWYSPAVYAQKPEVRIKRIKDNNVEVVRIAEPEIIPNENYIDVKYTIFINDIVARSYKTFTENHKMRHFSLPELDLLAEMGGFERLTAEAFLTSEEPSEKTWGLCLVYRRI